MCNVISGCLREITEPFPAKLFIKWPYLSMICAKLIVKFMYFFVSMKLILTRKADAFQKMAEDYYAMAVYNHALVIDKPYWSKKLKKSLAV